ncbi:FAD/NAD(P)-binding oxidoreductase [Pollutimonas nitritireducens]|uniref:FAD/NAD(P)-binding oxidoreductase n=1 Tax=Pollutimonas nitritireducens TaxID=2045209 RepID=A0A2N4UE21_9BURK|nr:NAD(P)/FAD-dependent oxidoreductase [Pollutimonas nitritireducens]PLC53263.1 FAD/NAD(P)-binding oxidoreductase [Pollutimonas nitritireducens]
MSSDADIVVIGAGPAGMAAATLAARCGAQVMLLDEQDGAGGQIWRSITAASEARLQTLGPDYAAGLAPARDFAQSGAQHITRATVWQVTRDGVVNYLHAGASCSIRAQRVILCSGAMERPFPIPGWTLPGVMTAGAAQILLKSAATVPTQPAVLAGCGPLLYLLAWQYVRAGVPIAAIIDTTDSSDYRRAVPHLPGALRAWPYLKKGLGLLRVLRKKGIPFFKGATNLEIEGADAVTAIRFVARGKKHRLQTALVLLHQGVVPNTQFTWALRAPHIWDTAQLCWRPDVDDLGRLAEVEQVLVAGDGRGIGGAQAAGLQGRLAALAALQDLGLMSADQAAPQVNAANNALQDHLRIRPFLDAMYRPKDANRIPADDVLVCRCEEVTAGAIRGFVKLGCAGPNQTKSFGRCGMGPCQGRLCGLTVTEVIAEARNTTPEEVGYYRIRPPIKPITLAELSAARDL